MQRMLSNGETVEIIGRVLNTYVEEFTQALDRVYKDGDDIKFVSVLKAFSEGVGSEIMIAKTLKKVATGLGLEREVENDLEFFLDDEGKSNAQRGNAIIKELKDMYERGMSGEEAADAIVAKFPEDVQLIEQIVNSILGIQNAQRN